MLDHKPGIRLEANQHEPALQSSALRWFCVGLMSNLEQMAKAGLAADGFQTCFPRIATLVSRDTWKIQSLFPGYGFVQFCPTIDPWHRIVDIPGIYRLFKHGPQQPTPLPHGAVEAFQAASDAEGVIYPPPAHKPRPGASYRLLDGPFASLTGICRWSDGNRVKLLMNLLGGQVVILVDAATVEAVTS